MVIQETELKHRIVKQAINSVRSNQKIDEISLLDLIQRPRVREVAQRQNGERELAFNQNTVRQKVSFQVSF